LHSQFPLKINQSFVLWTRNEIDSAQAFDSAQAILRRFVGRFDFALITGNYKIRLAADALSESHANK
jgi:hypothetical protein